MQKYLWLAVTADQYEFPIYIEDTAKKLGERLNISARAVTYIAFAQCNGSRSGRKIVKVRLDEEE